jgi:hypothetical protein
MLDQKQTAGSNMTKATQGLVGEHHHLGTVDLLTPQTTVIHPTHAAQLGNPQQTQQTLCNQ